MPTKPAKAAKQTLINPGSAGVVYVAAGHSLGGGERAEVDGLDDVGKAACDAGHLLTELAGHCRLLVQSAQAMRGGAAR